MVHISSGDLDAIALLPDKNDVCLGESPSKPERRAVTMVTGKHTHTHKERVAAAPAAS